MKETWGKLVWQAQVELPCSSLTESICSAEGYVVKHRGHVFRTLPGIEASVLVCKLMAV